MSLTDPFTAEFVYAQVDNSIAARIKAGRQMHHNQRVRLYVGLTTRETRFRSRPVEAVTNQYEKIVPGMAERILSMTERSVTGKIDIEDKLASEAIVNAKVSISAAFGLTLLAFAASVVFFALDNRVAGLAFLSFPVVMLIRSFLSRPDRNEPVENNNNAISAQ
jgi:uncharacterized membrane protein